MKEINVGDRVRSFDFAIPKESDTRYTNIGRDLTGPRACFIEGVVTRFRFFESDPTVSCDTMEILVDRDVFSGKEKMLRVGKTIRVPVNGTPTWLGSVTDGVELLENPQQGLFV